LAKEIRIEHVSKVFGDDPENALALARTGRCKQEVLARTGSSVGVLDVSLTIAAGEIFVVMGLSGSGKSTLVRMLNLLIKPTAGRIVVDGTDISTLSVSQLRGLRRKEISMVFQSFALMPHMTVLDNTAFGLALAGTSRAQRQALAVQALDKVGLAGQEASYPDELSGGMQQRVGLARALAADPSILLMDEAFSALDPIIRTEMQSELLRLQQVKRRTVVFISHCLDEAMRIGDRIAIMKDGQVAQVGTPDAILRNPANDYVRSFIHGVDAAAVFKAADIARKTQVVVSEHMGRGSRAALKMLEETDREYAYVVSPAQQYLGMVSVESLRAALHGHGDPVGLAQAFVPEVQPIDSDASVNHLYGQVAQAPYAVPVVEADGRFRGAISKTTLLKFLDRETPATPAHWQ
jgi:glycine betaine/proline transport system ATP-binding protein